MDYVFSLPQQKNQVLWIWCWPGKRNVCLQCEIRKHCSCKKFIGICLDFSLRRLVSGETSHVPEILACSSTWACTYYVCRFSTSTSKMVRMSYIDIDQSQQSSVNWTQTQPFPAEHNLRFLIKRKCHLSMLVLKASLVHWLMCEDCNKRTTAYCMIAVSSDQSEAIWKQHFRLQMWHHRVRKRVFPCYLWSPGWQRNKGINWCQSVVTV